LQFSQIFLPSKTGKLRRARTNKLGRNNNDHYTYDRYTYDRYTYYLSSLYLQLLDRVQRKTKEKTVE